MYPVDVLALSVTSCTLSVIGGTVIFATCFVLPEIRNFQSRKLVLCLTVADSITASAYLMSVIDYAITNNANNGTNKTVAEHSVCQVQSFLTTYSSLVSFFLTSLIAVYIFDTVVNRSNRLGNTKWLLVFNIVSWVVPGCIVVTALANGALGSDKTKTGGTGPWCWISTSADYKIAWMFVTGKAWEIACYLVTTSLYVLLKVYLLLCHRRERFHQIHISLRNEDQNFLYVWFLLYTLRVWGTVRFFLFITIDPEEETKYMDVLLRLQALGDPAQAFGNCILFCFLDKTVFEKIKRFICPTYRRPESERLLSSSPSRDDLYESSHVAIHSSNHSVSYSVERLSEPEQETNTSGFSSVASATSEPLRSDSVNSTTEHRKC